MPFPAWPRLSVLTLFLLCMAIPVWSATYYVSPAGSNSTSCTAAQNTSTPKLTVAAGIACLAGGDTLIVKAGTYNEIIPDTIPSGTPGNPTTVKSEVQHGAILRPDGSQSKPDGVGFLIFGWSTTRSYITFDGFVLDAISMPAPVYITYVKDGDNHHITIANNEIKNGANLDSPTSSSGFVIGHTAHDNVFRGNKVHDIGTGSSPGQAFYSYCSYFTGQNSVFENNELYNCSGFGIHMYDATGLGSSNNILRNNSVHDNKGSAILYASGGQNNQLYNNLVYHNGLVGGGNIGNTGIIVGGAGPNGNNNTVFHNTVYNNLGRCMEIGGSYSANSNIVRNNICTLNGTDSIQVNNGGGNAVDHNIFGNTPPLLFANAAGGNFHLLEGSPAIDTGMNVGVSTDISGVFRPQGATFDIGAYEFVPTTPVLATYYLSPTGSDSNTCAAAQSLTSPKRTFASVFPCMAGGSTLYLRAGVYQEVLNTDGQIIPTGLSWASPTLIASYPSETAIIQNPGIVGPVMWLRNATTDHYIVFDRLVLDGNNFRDANGFVTYPGVDHIRFQNGEIKNTTYEPVYIMQANQVEILTSQIHDAVGTLATIAIEGSTDVVIRGNTIFNSPVEGIGPKSGLNNTNLEISSNIIRQTGLSVSNAALLLGPSTNSLIMNNVLFGNAAGINVQTGASGVRLYNNTITGNTNAGILIDSGASGTLVKNNIVFTNGSAITDNGTGTIQATNKLTDPLFVNVALNNYQLQSTSTARDTGTTLSDVQFDFAGLRRPQGTAYDIGAYEFPVTAAPRPPTGLIVAY